ncbi:MAG: PTS system mannose/fructose/sorbose family transporter subunit IID [Candidatus Goldiibacteriota bacterium]
MKKITIGSLFWSGIKLNFLQASWNFERLQNAGFLFSVYNLLKRIYGGNEENMRMAVKRHLSFFNTHIFFSSAVVGVVAKLESELKNDNAREKDTYIENTKLGIMGPMAAIGDSLFWSGIKPFALLVGSGMVMMSGFDTVHMIWAAAVSLLIYNIPRVLIKYYLLFKAYYRYQELFLLIQKIRFQDIMKSIRIAAMIFLGGVMAGFLNLREYDRFQNPYADSLMMMSVFFLSVFALKKKVSVSNIFVAVLIISIILSYAAGG